jgi:hypothetical protein
MFAQSCLMLVVGAFMCAAIVCALYQLLRPARGPRPSGGGSKMLEVGITPTCPNFLRWIATWVNENERLRYRVNELLAANNSEVMKRRAAESRAEGFSRIASVWKENLQAVEKNLIERQKSHRQFTNVVDEHAHTHNFKVLSMIPVDVYRAQFVKWLSEQVSDMRHELGKAKDAIAQLNKNELDYSKKWSELYEVVRPFSLIEYETVLDIIKRMRSNLESGYTGKPKSGRRKKAA